jgi:hypothetical protein
MHADETRAIIDEAQWSSAAAGSELCVIDCCQNAVLGLKMLKC